MRSLVWLAVGLACGRGFADTGTKRAAEFTLSDQFGEVWSHTYPRSRVGVIVFADREGAGRMAEWIDLLKQRYAGRIEVLGVAVLGEVPGALRGFVRREFRKRYRLPVLLDWGGDVARHFEYQEGQPTVCLVDRRGMQVRQWSGRAEPSAVEDFCRALDGALVAGGVGDEARR